MSRDLLSVTQLVGPGPKSSSFARRSGDVMDPELGIDICLLYTSDAADE